MGLVFGVTVSGWCLGLLFRVGGWDYCLGFVVGVTVSGWWLGLLLEVGGWDLLFGIGVWDLRPDALNDVTLPHWGFEPPCLR